MCSSDLVIGEEQWRSSQEDKGETEEDCSEASSAFRVDGVSRRGQRSTLAEEEPLTGLPGRRPLGRDEDLLERDKASWKTTPKKRYFVSNEDQDDLGAPSTLFDDFDRFESPAPVRPPRPGYRRREKHRGAWAAVAVICLLLLAAMGVAVVPQLTGVRYQFLPNLAFVNGNLIRLDSQRLDYFSECVREVYTDRVYQGVYIDQVHVGGMTLEEAVSAVSAVHDDASGAFDITVTVGNESWHVNSERVPVSRNTQAVAERARAEGRSNTAGLAGDAVTPFQERVDQVAALRSHPVILATEQTYDREALRNLTDGIVNYVNRDPVNSMVKSFDFNTKTFTFTDDRPGAYIDPDSLYAQLTEVLDEGTTRKEVRVIPEKVLAEITKTELMNNFGLISAYTTQTTNNNNRNTNIRLSAEAINGKTVLPGEIFSFNGATGERTAAKGYKEAPAIAGGQSKDEVGGGVKKKSYSMSSTYIDGYGSVDYSAVEGVDYIAPENPVIKLGDRVLYNYTEGDDVKELQQSLISLGFDCGSYGADGEFGDCTEMAVTNFQKAHGLTASGRYDAATHAALTAALAAQPGDADPTIARYVEIQKNKQCYVRTQPNTDGDKLGIAHSGDRLPYLGTTYDNGWFSVKYKDKPACVSGKYARLVE